MYERPRSRWCLLRSSGVSGWWLLWFLWVRCWGWVPVLLAQRLMCRFLIWMRRGVHRSAVERLAADGVFDGTDGGLGEFCPGDAVQRWVTAVWLVRLLDTADPAPVGSTRFADVDVSQW